MNRREFLKAGAESAAFVLPLALTGGCCTGSRGGERRLRFGFMTDTHVTPNPTSHHKLRKALELFKAKGCELVVNAGDICDHFYPEGYAAYRRTATTGSTSMNGAWRRPVPRIRGVLYSSSITFRPTAPCADRGRGTRDARAFSRTIR